MTETPQNSWHFIVCCMFNFLGQIYDYSIMDSSSDHDPTMWPPGTVRIEDIHRSKGKDIILSPQPTDDPNDPLNWPRWRKYWNFALCCFYALMIFVLIDAATPTWEPMHVKLGFSYTDLNNSYAVGCGTLAFGAFLLVPFALKYGRRPVYIVTTTIQFGVAIWSAKMKTVADLMLINAFSCGVGALSEVIVQMTVADVFFIHERGAMNTIYVWAIGIGGSLAPVASGYITLAQGWRWVWWWNAILFGICILLFVFTYEETKYTYPITMGVSPGSQEILCLEPARTTPEPRARCKKGVDSIEAPIRSMLPDTRKDRGSVARCHDTVRINNAIPQKSYWQRLSLTTKSEGSFNTFARHAYQPVAILFTIPAVCYMSVVYGVILSYAVVMITMLSSFMTLPPYNFDSGQIGLMSIPAFIGTTLGAIVVGPLSDWSIIYLSRRNNGIYEPEMRLWMMAPFVPFIPIGALMFGIGLNNGLPWPVIAVGYAICNLGITPISSIALTYITDSYTEVSRDLKMKVERY